MKNLSKLMMAFALLFFGVNAVKAQSSLRQDKAMKAKRVEKFVNSKDYVFEATHTGYSRGDRQLPYHRYDIALDKDTLIAHLPGSARPVKFDCTNYAYHVSRANNGGWHVLIRPRASMTRVKEINMNISSQGEARVRVDRSNMGPLNFNGYIKQESY